MTSIPRKRRQTPEDGRPNLSAGNDRAAPENRNAVRAYLNMYGRLRDMLERKTGCAASAADIIQETYVRLGALENLDMDRPEAFVNRIASNLAIDWHRSFARRGVDLNEIAERAADLPSPEQALLAKERLRRVLKATEQLPPKCRAVFILRKIEGLDHREIAQRMGITMNMVQRHIRKALEGIQTAIDDE
jgi:RNA polymerase sigma factor (sigma-70 family)